MINQLFNKALCMSDIHFGLRHNSKEHNEDCMDYLQWFVEQAREKNAETCFFLGDFTHHRNSVNTHTLNYMMDAMRLLNDNFKKTYFIVGNHDMFWRNQRDIHSLVIGTEFENIEIIDKITIKNDVAIIPYLVEEEWKEVQKIKSKYVFGHLELPGFKMNAMVEMPDHGNLNSSHFKYQDHVFSGHFHKRQTKGKITYIGNPFGHNYSDVWDFERGAMFLEWNKEPEFLNYEDGPRYISINLSTVLENPELYLKPKTYLQVILDMDITYEEATFLRETFLTQYNVRDFKLIKNPSEDISIDNNVQITMKTVDTIVVEQLESVESTTIDSKKLIEIYNNL